ncbi:ABC transporter permease [Phreatobacter aquaticus]|uniref:ABC transporter permease n=1 Tax=Phreatobacter aquaticus TaxID=2570229 RepID=A0A4D7QI56_9HYPH|nr:ABC transporter permease [Phreatobacter aquaticus]QCK85134.1 ABC transporter permease [Phreatobacter aquaticus]
MQPVIDFLLNYWPAAIAIGCVAFLAKVLFDVVTATSIDKTKLALKLAPVICTIGTFLVWELFCKALNVSTFVLPAPSTIISATWEFRRQIGLHSFHTAWMTLAGFGLAVAFGVALGLVLGASRFFYAGFYPLMVGFNSIPKVAVVPILVIWFGVGWLPAVLTAFMISFFPIVVNVATGLATIEPETEDVLKALGASKLQIMTKVGIPRSLPYFFGSLKVAITLAYVGSVIAEYNASRFGIGNLMARASADFNVPLLFASLIALAILGVAMYMATVWLENRMTGWAQRSSFAAG